ncbi:Flp pilus assembly protein CpaB [Maribius pontilimi]|uniref:Flp pilus assembly protein CpaB n=1 Tax=Palleronia pontilimi TaxID=1964209 RepID=A0A934MB19_9RHOB|nr:Flp pilus assembly protein CpaB [Palleronia pontilimi]MBJ3761253.1 Flp pilus assembly protein CpaB [Palleronia pontilimi]
MRLVFGLVLLLGLGLAGFAVFMAKDYMAAHQAALDAERASRGGDFVTKPVFVTSRDIAYGERLTAEDVRQVLFPEEAISVGAFLEEEALFPQGPNVQRSVLRSMVAGEAILANKVTEPGMEAGVASRLSPGKRAFAIRVDVSSGVSGFLRPGDRVDVYWTGTVNSKGVDRQEVTKLIQAGVKLVAIDQSADEDRSEATVARTVTVEATPRDVAALAQAQSTGSLSLSLVGNEDDTVAGAVEIDQRELLGIVEEQRAEVKQEQVCTIRTRRGADVIEIPIPCTN